MSIADKIFVDMCKDIIENGTSTEGEKVRPVWPDGTSAYTIKKFGVVNRYDLSKEFPALTLRKTGIKSCTDEILWIWQRKSNNIHDLKPHIWDEWADEDGSIGKAYGYQMSVKHQYKEGMFEGLTVDKRVSKETLEKYESLVETSLFKKLFNEAKNNKFMLIKQYRSHKQIMDIVNLFYEDKLVLGNKDEQNNLKEHYLELTSNDLKLFTSKVHTYWFNSYYNKDNSVSYEKKLVKGGKVSSSFYNESELEITKNLLVKINEGYKDLKDKDISVGVISLYKDQVNLLKKEVNKINFDNIRFNKSKISSVDEFQGKEEDIIIVNLVRNNKSRNAGDFVKKFERINVALSRARKMLIIVGAREFFETLHVELENLDDSTIKKVRRLYKEIYNRVEGHIDNPYSYF